MARKLCYCDGCGKDRADVQTCGRDSNGDPDAPDLCFLCRREGAKGKAFDRHTNRYVWPEVCYSL
jgi:hypothetical protein